MIEVEINPQQGRSLSQQIHSLKELIFDRRGDFSIVLAALQQKGISRSNINEYDNFRFVYISRITYDADGDNFPKLTSTNTPASIHNIKYMIKLSLISEHSSSQEDY